MEKFSKVQAADTAKNTVDALSLVCKHLSTSTRVDLLTSATHAANSIRVRTLRTMDNMFMARTLMRANVDHCHGFRCLRVDITDITNLMFIEFTHEFDFMTNEVYSLCYDSIVRELRLRGYGVVKSNSVEFTRHAGLHVGWIVWGDDALRDAKEIVSIGQLVYLKPLCEMDVHRYMSDISVARAQPSDIQARWDQMMADSVHSMLYCDETL